MRARWSGVSGIVAAAIWTLAPPPASAAGSICAAVAGNLAANCGFETGDLTGWTTGGNLSNPPGGLNGSEYGVDASDANSGNYGMYAGPIGAAMTFWQPLTLNANVVYTVTFYVKQGAAPVTNSNHSFTAAIQNAALTATLDSLLTLSNPSSAGSFTEYQYAFTPTVAQLGGASGTVALVFSFRSDDSYWSLDDVSVAAFSAPTVSKAFSPASIETGQTSTVTVTLNNPNSSALTGGAFTDTLTNMSASGGAVGGTCQGVSPATLNAGQTALTFTGIAIPAAGSCTVTFVVTGSTSGSQTNVTSGVSTAQTGAAGAASNTAILTVFTPPAISESFSPSVILPGGTSQVTITLTNSNSAQLVGASFSVPLTNLHAVSGAVTGTCSGTTPDVLSSGATALMFSGVTVPASGSCTVSFAVSGAVSGVYSSSASALTTIETPVSAPGSSSNTLTVTTPCDVNLLGSTTVSDVQSVIDQALGILSPANDLNGDRVVNGVDIQIAINAALNKGCAAN